MTSCKALHAVLAACFCLTLSFVADATEPRRGLEWIGPIEAADVDIALEDEGTIIATIGARSYIMHGIKAGRAVDEIDIKSVLVELMATGGGFFLPLKTGGDRDHPLPGSICYSHEVWDASGVPVRAAYWPVQQEFIYMGLVTFDPGAEWPQDGQEIRRVLFGAQQAYLDAATEVDP